MKGSKEIIKKEMNRVFGDKKLIFSLFILPVVIMVGMFFLMGNLEESLDSKVEKHIPSIYIQNAPEGLGDIINAAKFEADIVYLNDTDNVDTIKDEITDGTKDLLVNFPADFTNLIANYTEGSEVPEIKTYFNPSEEYSSTARTNFVAIVLEPMRQSMLSSRIGDLNSITIFNIDKDIESSQLVDEEKATGKALGTFLPYFITMMLFAGVMSIAVDAITGEKERGTLASMLISPVKRSSIVAGKLISIAILSSISALIYSVGMIFGLPKMMGADANELSISLSAGEMLELVVIMLTMVYLYVALVSIVAVYAKTVKEASTYISPLYILVIVAGIFTMFSGSETPAIKMFAIPVYGSALCIQNIMQGTLETSQFLASAGGTLALALLLTAGIIKAFNSEKVMFNA